MSWRHLATVVEALKSSCVQSCTMPVEETSSARMTACHDATVEGLGLVRTVLEFA